MSRIELIGFTHKLRYFNPQGVLMWECTEENIIPDDSIAYILGSSLNSVTPLTSWYIGLYENSWTPGTTETMTTFIANAGESVAYSGSVRIALVPDAIAAGVYSNAASPAEFVFTGAATIRGSIITSNPTRANSAGLLLSADEYSSAKVMESGATLEVTTGLTLSRV